MKISLIIVTKNRPQELKHCLESILSQETKPDEIIVIDSSNDEVNAEIINKYPNLNIRYFSHFMGGTSKARNYGIRNAAGEVLVFVDDDVILHQSYVKGIKQYFLDNPDVGAITGPTYDLSDIIHGISSSIEMNNLLKSNDPFFKQVVKEIKSFSGLSFVYLYNEYLKNRTKRILSKIIKSLFFLDSFKMGIMLPSGFGSSFSPLSEPYDVERLNGCNMAFKKDVLALFMFSEELEKASSYAIYEDHELGYRLSRMYRISMVPSIILCHKKTPTARVDYLSYYDAIVTNVYYIVKNDLCGVTNKIAFIWSQVGVVCGLFVIYLKTPTKQNKDKLNGIISGIKRIFHDRQ